MEKIKILSLFSGIGAFEKALTNLKIPFELVNFSEIEKISIDAYCALHDINESKNLGDINLVNEKEIPDFDLMTYGFPCQAFSSQGCRLGFDDPTKGNLFFESIRIAKEKQPKWMIAENVKGLITHDHGNTIRTVLKTLNDIGYNNYYKLLNSSRYGVAQNRERIFIVSIRKDIDNHIFQFDMGRNPYVFVKDIIDPTIKNEDRKLGLRYIPWINKEYHLHKPNITKNRLIILVDLLKQKYIKVGFSSRDKILGINGLSTTLTTDNSYPTFYDIGGVLTGKERLKLQGFTDEDYEKIKFLSESQLAFVTGNSITVNVLEMIFTKLFNIEKPKENDISKFF
jgi:DNA (cytosine-5)-methyltransferase 1